MRRVSWGVLTAGLLGALAAGAVGQAGARVASNPCVTVGLTPSTLAKVLGHGAYGGPGSSDPSACGIFADGGGISIYLYPKADATSYEGQESTFHHKQVLGGLGHDAVLLYDQAGAGGGWVYMTAGAYFIELDGQEVPNAILESLAHAIYRKLG